MTKEGVLNAEAGGNAFEPTTLSRAVLHRREAALLSERG